MELLGPFDRQIFGLVNGTWHHPILDLVMPFVSDFGNFKLPIIVAAAVAWWLGPPERRWRLIQLVLLVLLTDMAGGFIKEWIGASRPYESLGDAGIRLVGQGAHGKSASFPSNHAL